jgi:hypothetical protein
VCEIDSADPGQRRNNSCRGWKKPSASPLDVGLEARVWDSGFGVGGSGVGTFGTPFWNLSKRFGV